MEKGTELCDIG